MARFTNIERKAAVPLFDIIKFQIITYCFFKQITLNETELKCMTLLGMKGKTRLNEFCKVAFEQKYLGSATAVSNCLDRLERSGLYIKEGVGKKVIFLNPELGIKTSGNIKLDYQIFSVNEENA